ncbi:RAS, putative [Ixodes scapularis]|uniref:small monomeric GTPase n=1 Tax=Ixodes scapularis TaxID=6945 RepID=B7QFI6_IXOSC|nr:RAS, putative [Ixodes scapularis]|eukprot:XP_002414300.1 RAS, putative [Ixodes scapularis]
MSSNAIRGIRRKKSTISEVKIAVLGATGVGKSALVVRFLTKRYIGEYDHQTGLVVSLVSFVLPPPPVAPQSEDELPRDDVLQWADGFMLVYSIVDRSSFRYLRLLRQHLQTALPALQRAAQAAGGSAPGATPMHPVSTEEGEILAKDSDDGFVELTASEQVLQVAQAFADLCRDVYAHWRRSKQSLLDRVLAGTKGITAKANDPGGRK